MTIDTTIETLMQENATLRAEVERLKTVQVWEPVKVNAVVGFFSDSDINIVAHELMQEIQDTLTVEILDNIRLCRLVSQEA